MTNNVCFSLVLVFVFSLPVYSEIYKWTDENGKVIYSDRPSSGKTAEQLHIKKNRHNTDNPLIKRNERVERLLEVMQEERDKAGALKEREKQHKARQQKECAKWIAKLKKIREAIFLYQKMDDPKNPNIYSNEERKRIEERYQHYINENC